MLLGEPAFERDGELLLAIPGARAPEVLEALLVRRGPTRASLRALVAHVADGGLRDVIVRVLHAFGARALPHLVSAYADTDRPASQRRALAELLDHAGAATVPLLCDGFGATPSALDADIVARLCALGDAAVDPLLDAYRRGGLVERLAGPLARRRTHRRERILQAIAGIGGRRARLVLHELLRDETDADLKLRIAQRIHGLDSRPEPKRIDADHRRPEGDHGQTG